MLFLLEVLCCVFSFRSLASGTAVGAGVRGGLWCLGKQSLISPFFMGGIDLFQTVGLFVGLPH